MGHLLPVVARKSRQVITQKPPVTEQNVRPAEVPPKAAERRLALVGHCTRKDLTFETPFSARLRYLSF